MSQLNVHKRAENNIYRGLLNAQIALKIFIYRTSEDSKVPLYCQIPSWVYRTTMWAKKFIFTNKDLKYEEVKLQTLTMASSDFQTVTLSSSDCKYVVSFIKTGANLPEMKLQSDNKKPG